MNITGIAGDAYTVGGWAKGDSAPNTDSSRYFALDVMFHNTDGTNSYYIYPFNTDSTDWQYVSGGITAAKAYSYIKVYALYYDNVNAVYFDGLQLYKEAFGTSYTYDNNGNVTNIGAINNSGTNGDSNTVITYPNNDPTTIQDPAGNTTTNGFDSNHNETSAATANTEDTTDYNTNGDVTSDKTVDPNNSTGPSIETDTSYISDGNYTATTTDETRHTTTYNYDSQMGTLQWLQNPNDTPDTKTSYSYDSINRMTGVSKPVAGLYNGVAQMQNAYTYEDDNIKTISHNNTTAGNDTTYTFDYGDMRTLTDVKVGSGSPRTLVANTYATSDRSYDLTKATYGNGQWVQYTYDNRDRVTGIQYNNDSGNNRFSMIYNNAGNIGSLTDNANKLNTSYIYDMADNLQSINETGINGRTYSHFYTWAFDADRNITKFIDMLNGSTWTTNYAYDGDNRLTQASYNYGSRSSLTGWAYDGYGRVTARNVTDNGAQIFDTNYLFATDGTHTSNLVYSVENKKHSGSGYDKTLTYQYDSNGNITSINNGVNATTYTYDGANQLVREDNQAAGKTWSWIYDAGGNIREKREYAYTTDTDLTGKTYTSIAYGYTDPNGWGDLLTSYNGTALSYDGLGNLTNDGTKKYGWEGGRNLITLTDENNNALATYTYNKDGIRTSKTVNGITTTYTLVDSRVTQETDGTNNIYYRYDSNNSLISMNLNGTEYYYFFDAQGDVVGLFDNNGAMVVEYAYDAWGNLTFEKDGQGLDKRGDSTFIGNINPYRYRGYRFDMESGLYYLQSRYYSPAWGRFVNEDASLGKMGEVLSTNMFAYCLNNPVNNIDPTGFMTGTDCFQYLSLGALLYESAAEIAAVVAETLLPILAAIFWWAPYVIAGVIVLAIAAVVTWKVAQLITINNIKKKIPSKLMLGDRINLALFKYQGGPQMPKGGRPLIGPLGWQIVKDIDGHRGSAWKLLDWAGNRIASIAADGRIVGK